MGSLITNENGSRQYMFLAVMSVFLLISYVAVTLRLYCRYFCLKVLGLDDFIIIGALVATTGMAIQNGFHISLGTGRHTDELPLQQIMIPTLKHWYAYQIVYPFVLYLVKLSILALYHRILTQRNFRLWVWAVSGFITVQTVVVMFVQAFECGSRVSGAWSPTFPEGCNNVAASYYSMSSINVFTDIVILVMPLPTLAKLKINIRKKCALMGIFLTGGVAITASCLRFYALHVYDTTEDVAYDAIYIEVNLAIITASAPALRPLFKKTFAGSSDRSKYGYHGYPRRSHMNAGRGAVELQAYNGKHEAVIAANMAGEENSSQECILEWGNHRGIVKTVETKVSSGAMSEA
ncbi:hypothetical protein MBM_01909 [Drepanopeziza brunnea f. sp. 'multigermtubi' MB_m1]|uniref:Rhodopsin domain-containing protein n=1 Tax=Marssonina brunnea f. sp. multigermtubi (strain MB_m1) TaxID=1072389 RepID=K1X4G0_MARBU|nr:uncharacterized protein MBM_01909 [Drepanopeziza brunnea f. sp. 'multigermtubi' MB_m1]EKD19957.1 hypothetical protein MBM_01909 [Drepanopeziza brunnea f. sp. 'multigermtubi' MB_m1]